MYFHKDVSQTTKCGLGLHSPSTFQSDISYPSDLSSLSKGSVIPEWKTEVEKNSQNAKERSITHFCCLISSCLFMNLHK